MIVSKFSLVNIVSDEIISFLAFEISVVKIITGEVIFYVLYVVSKVSVVSDGNISGIQNHGKQCSQ